MIFSSDLITVYIFFNKQSEGASEPLIVILFVAMLYIIY